MTQAHDPAVAAPAPRRRRRWPSVLLVLLSLLLLLVGRAAGTDHHECCAIDCEAYPEACAQRERDHERREQNGKRIAAAAFTGSLFTLGGAVLLLGRR